jgi:GTP cyclohydrolase II
MRVSTKKLENIKVPVKIMVKDRPLKTSTPSALAATAPCPRAVRSAVERALSELRRGQPVVIYSLEHNKAPKAILAQAAESFSGQTGERPEIQAAGPSVLALTAQRAAVLALSSGLFEASAASDGATSKDGKVVVLPLPVAFDAAILRGLSDPTSEHASGPFAHLPTVPAPAGDLNEAAVDLARLALLLPACICTPLAEHLLKGFENDQTGVHKWALDAGFLAVSATDIAIYQARTDCGLTEIVSVPVPLALAQNTRITAFRPEDGGSEHYAIEIGDPAPGEPILTRIHSACFTGDLLGSLRCDCGDQLRGALTAMAESKTGSGILLYLTQEGRGIGLANKLRAYALQDHGFDTFEANEQLGFDADERLFRVAADMLRSRGFDKVRLMTNNPAKVEALECYDIEITERVAHAFPANGHNEAYLKTKAVRAGHHL